MRWKFVIPAAIFVAAIALFNILFLDAMIKKAVVASGEFIFGARVEVVSLKTRFRDMSIKIKGLAVANKKETFKNLFEIGEIRFSINPVHLLSKKFIINEMIVSELKTGTERKTSGALPPKKIKKHDARRKKEKKTFTGKLMARLKEKGEKEIKALPAFGSIKSFEKEIKGISIQKAFSVDDIESLKEFENLKSSFSDKNEQYKKKLSDFKTDEKLALVNAQIRAVSEIKLQSASDIEPAKKTLNELNAARQELENVYKEIAKTREELAADFGANVALIARINELKNKDYERISQKLKLPQISFGNLSEAIFGPVWINRVNAALHYIELARKYMPSRKKGDKKVIFVRRKGRDVMFPKEYTPPAFLLKKTLLSGSFGSTDPLGFTGIATDITSDPVLHGQPVIIKMEGSKGVRRIDLFSQLDHTKEASYDLVRITYNGLDAAALGLPESEYLPSLKDAAANVSAEILLSGENIDSRLKLNITNVRPRSESGDDEISRRNKRRSKVVRAERKITARSCVKHRQNNIIKDSIVNRD